MQDNERIEVVRRWAEAWNRMDWDGVAETFAPDGANHSMMHEPMLGREEIRRRTRMVMERVSAVNLRFARIGVLDHVVVTERIDACRRADGSWGEAPVAGFYEVEAGLIVAKRDYYDRRQLLEAMALPGEFVSVAKAG
ncbi:nuclear transport factor 2 family protein [Phenylobacterium sp.]|uniref:nuclear transport factor 2 family protein n=1 Tax=Phenylobacterium sp. TaxID=1871053 RepID=UPI0025DA9EA2|nr:nuclear transport factor 2 family protein [Phenylobacterium sp.]MBX3482016.1 nuclear transport factor 2 family protein [Phenylobacterium sp.]MCW5758242.1 nuclear transport factor 2 family protein [Phenylobacterium sp.]